ncbi:chaperone protein dnaJ 6 [Sphaerosporella brunnea]|uniref:Chaperone protein dnaJ 6 n=1 Tax=Sphaerosporella brunnea TaxID=1250544 RepID=A0A5J5EE65_9PEZI|nr:chaperone protein dnaJ 6 [Sphaerosporella brunnea]
MSDTESDGLPANSSELDPYEILGVPNTATAEEIRSAYRKLALQRHPDKAPAAERAAAHTAFQELAFAYAILSDDARRARYDSTGSTSESALDVDEDFDWKEFFKAQFKEVSKEALEEFKTGYQGSDEERQAVLDAYTDAEGDLDAVFEHVMASDVIADEARFREIIDAAIADGTVEAYDAYTKETASSKKKRRANAKKEAKEAEAMAKKMGVHEALFGDKAGEGGKKGKKKKGEEEDTSALAAIIKSRGAGRMDALLSNLEARYGGGAKKKGTSKRAAPPPPPTEEEFEAARSRVTAGRKKRRT